MIYLIILGCLYFFPAILVLCNKNASADDRIGVIALNLLFGWTLIGWFIAATLAQVDYKNARKVKLAKDNFYLRAESQLNSVN